MNKSGAEIPIMFSRQSGKTTAVVHTVEVLLLYYQAFMGEPIAIGIFAPQSEQAKTDFDRLKYALENQQLITDYDLTFPESNATTLNVYGGDTDCGYCYIFPITKTSNPESKTLDLAIYEESQNIDDVLRENKIDPMLAATNGSKVFIGTEGYQHSYFLKLVDKFQEEQPDKLVKCDCDQAIKEKRILYDLTKDEDHLNYEKYIKSEKEKGEDRQSFKVQYLLERCLDVGTYITRRRWERTYSDYPFSWSDKQNACVVGIDLAKAVDKTVVAVGKVTRHRKIDSGRVVENQWLDFIAALEIRGDDYVTQTDLITDFLGQFNIEGLAIDATSVGDPVAKMLYDKTRIAPFMPIQFTLKSKDEMYRNLQNLIDAGEFRIPSPKQIGLTEKEKKILSTLEEEMLQLEIERKGANEQFMSIHHPDKDDAHDDYPDALALMTFPYLRVFQPNAILTTKPVNL